MDKFFFKDLASKVHGWLTFKEGRLLSNLAIKSRGDVVEIGSWKGLSTIIIAKILVNSGRNIIAIDPHLGSKEHIEILGHVDTYEEFISNLKAFSVEDVVIPVRLKSGDAIPLLKNKVIGFVFIDGSHEYKDVCNDIRNYKKIISLGGHIVLHDAATFFGVIFAVLKEIVISKDLRLISFVDTAAVVKKKQSSLINPIFNIFVLITFLPINIITLIKNLTSTLGITHEKLK